jgi:hypothetical protein
MTYLVGAETAQHIFSLLGSPAPVPSAYGPFDTLVQVASAAVATAGALIALVFSSTRWNPMKGGPLEWLSVLAVAVGVLILGKAPNVVLIPVAIVGVLLALGCGVKYSGKLGMFRYQMETTHDAKGKVRRRYVVKGDAYTEQAEIKVKEGVLLEDIVKSAQYNPDNVWTPESRAKNLHQLELWYLPMVISGTLGLAAAAMYFG